MRYEACLLLSRLFDWEIMRKWLEMMKLFFKVRTLAKSHIDFLFLYVRSVWKTRLKTKLPHSDFWAHHNAIKIFDEPPTTQLVISVYTVLKYFLHQSARHYKDINKKSTWRRKILLLNVSMSLSSGMKIWREVGAKIGYCQ